MTDGSELVEVTSLPIVVVVDVVGADVFAAAAVVVVAAAAAAAVVVVVVVVPSADLKREVLTSEICTVRSGINLRFIAGGAVVVG